MTGEKAITDTIEYLNLNSNRVGEILTEYDWRECCGLVLVLEALLKTGALKDVEIPNEHIT